MNSGALNKRIKCYGFDKTKVNTANEIVGELKLLLETWAKVETIEVNTEAENDALKVILITTRFQQAITDVLAIKLPSGAMIDVLSIVNENEDNRFLIIRGKKVD